MDRFFKRVLIFSATLVLGFAFTMQVRTGQLGVGIVTAETIPQLKNELHNYNSEIEGLREQLAALRERVEEYEDAMGKQGNLNELLEKQLLNAQALAGLTDVEGPGIEIVLNDSKEEAALGNDPNLLLVHDEDILIVVSELKAAGAEAISINGQRIMFNSEIRCGGPTINVNSVRYAPPYIIRAIGDTNTLYGYMSGPESGYLDLLEYYGLQVSILQRERIVIPAYSGVVNLKYVKLRKEGE
ncbi:MAG: Division initiation protein [Firmicutes bacterium]|nr:Division initiation protein [Bacillota bacterium]MDI6706324.1 DUF881 domain-containing protein [Bacillota bacterium]